MKVNVTNQIFSHSVYAAITNLRQLKLKGLEDSKPTCDFICLMNDLFDMLNLKSKFGENSLRRLMCVFARARIGTCRDPIMRAIDCTH